MDLTENLSDFIEKFGAIREANPEIFDKISGTVFKEKLEWQENADIDAE